MSEDLTIVEQGDRLLLRIPRDYPGPLSDVVAFARARLAGATVDWTALREAYRFGRGRPFPVASRDSGAAVNERLKVRISPDGLEAYLLLYPPRPQGRRIDEAELFDWIGAYGIPPALLDGQTVRLVHLRRSYHEPELIARGRAPSHGAPSFVQWRGGIPTDPAGFLTAADNAPESPEAVLVEARPGEIVGVRQAPAPGKPGVSVRGEAIPARPGEDRIRLGPGLVLDPEDRVIAVQGGHLRIQGAEGLTASLWPLLRISDAQGLRPWAGSTHPGSVIVDGDLELPFPVRILGDLEVRGGLVRSSVEVLGSLFVRDGVIQARETPVRAGGVVSAGFLERTWVVAHTVHVRRYALKSRIQALEAVVTAAGGGIQGGQTLAGLRMACETIGAPNGMPTEVVVGAPNSSDPFQPLFREWAASLSALNPAEDPAGEAQAAAARWQEAAESLAQPDPLAVRLEAGGVHPGVTVRIGPAMRLIQSPLGPVEFRYERIGPAGRVALIRR